MEEETDPRQGRRLKKAEFWRVSAKSIREAVGTLLNGFGEHPFRDSTDYDVLVDDGRHLPPKAVFGVAARRALGIDVTPRDFGGGEGTPCFKAIRAAGFPIVPKGGDGAPPLVPDERAWFEGDPKRETHARYERDREAVRRKKQDFRDKHNGRLGCESFGFVPHRRYGEENVEACMRYITRYPSRALGGGRQQSPI